MKKGSEESKCDSDTNEFGFDCYEQAYRHDEMRMELDGTETICALLLFAEGRKKRHLSTCSGYSVDYNYSLSVHSYNIGAAQEFDDIDSAFTTNPSSASDCWYYKVWLLSPSPSADPQAVRYDSTDKKVYIQALYDQSAGDYHVRIEAKDSVTGADVLNPSGV